MQNPLKVITKLKPKGDQPKAIIQIAKNLKNGIKNQILLGVTGSGKTFTMAKVIENIQKPVLVISPNKTLCAQLYQEFKEFFPNNAVHYFVSYYDYYQPEAYIPQTDAYIEKDAKINEELDRLRHAATQDLSSRKDVIIVASVSCIYNIGSPDYYQKVSLELKTNQKISRKELLLHLISLGYKRNDIDFKPATFRARGDLVDVYLVTGQEILRIELSGDRIIKISTSDNALNLNQKLKAMDSRLIFPAHFWVAPQNKLDIALENIRLELQEQVKKLKKNNLLLEAQRLEQRTNYDLEMIRETEYCHGIENYSRHMEFRKPGEAPYTLIDYFNKDFVVFVDESHLTLSQIKAMSIQDRARKTMLIEHGFRLPSAVDNRPLTFDEFEKKISQVVYVSATPGEYEMQKIRNQKTEILNNLEVKKPKSSKENRFSTRQTNPLLVEQLIRPTGLLEPTIEIRPINPKSGDNQVQDLIKEVKKRAERKERSLVITLTKKLAEALSDHFTQEEISCQWLHSEVKTLERPKILNELRSGKYDVLIGINLLREGLDLPEVSLVAILDADKEGFLRSKTTLIQTMGRASRNLVGHVILYADDITGSMKEAIKEIERRRKIQTGYNKKHGITPKQIVKAIRKWSFAQEKKAVDSEFWQIQDRKLLEREMKIAASNLDFERAAEIRDLINKLKT
ncbi:MAG: excinuclease ABC subunit B [Candidatus Wildermuthbacteria bacterium RIFCSPHIGHO2_12_FULL_40_12]|uniref:UvrABC system protein B n=1 Tax=Candidatus Wildermuthbacteria bacterium RIFCSPHIGHO2_12_FULL_40_12 TaxID=1802457 RepID=A0A1G2RBQ6_9BACT|nr:MAG: excinuclease ABC subunit B [Candidatus Wildermuthbacteria bacterium RIFCSPHIGHO2_12_FULL_40_12]